MTSFFPSRATGALPTYDSENNLPVSASIGELAFVEDTQSLYVYDLSGWLVLSSSLNLAAVGTAVLRGGTCTIDPGNVSYSISDGWGIFVDYATTPHPYFVVKWSGLSNIPVNNTRPNTYIGIDSTGALYESGSAFTIENERDHIYLAGYVQVAGSILAIKSAPVLGIAPANQINDILRAIGVFKVSGITFSGIAATLSLSRSSGILFDRSNNWKNSEKNPHQITISAQSPLQFKRVTQTTIDQTNYTTLDVTHYDVGGVITVIGGSSNQAQNMRVYQFGTGTVYVQYGQQLYGTLSAAVAGIAGENFVTNSVASPDNAVLVCIISVIKGASDLTNTTQAIFHLAGKFGDQGGGASGSIAAVTLQQAYDNSAQPEIQTTLTGGALQIRRGTTAVAGDVLTIESQAGSRVAAISDTGALTINTSTGVLHSDVSGNITSSLIVNADIDGAAAIDGTKINPDFGSQAIDTTGTLYAGFADITNNLRSPDIFGSLDAYTIGGTLSIGTGNATTINIGTGPTATAINLGGSGDTVTIEGTLAIVNVTNLNVTDKLITLNDGGGVASGAGSGIEVEENATATAYVKVNSGRTGWQLKGPTTGIMELQGSGSDTVLLASSTVPRTHTFPDASGTVVNTGTTGLVTSTMIANDTIVDADINSAASISGSKIQAASASNAGVVTTGTQVLAGSKEFSTALTLSGSPGAAATNKINIGAAAANQLDIVGDNTFRLSISTAGLTGNRSISAPNLSGEIVVASGTQSIGGVKTFTSNTAFTSGTASTSSTTGALTVTGGIGVSGDINSAGTTVNVGINRAGAGAATFGLIAQAGGTTSDSALTRGSGANGNLSLLNAGTGVIDIRNTAGTSTGQGVAVQGYRNGAIGSGYVGQYGELATTASGSSSSGSYVAILTTPTLDPGIWMIWANYDVDMAGAGSWGFTINNSGVDNVACMVFFGNSSSGRFIGSLAPIVVSSNVSFTRTLYGRAGGSTGTWALGRNYLMYARYA